MDEPLEKFALKLGFGCSRGALLLLRQQRLATKLLASLIFSR
jgi:hypothetical protein